MNWQVPQLPAPATAASSSQSLGLRVADSAGPESRRRCPADSAAEEAAAILIALGQAVEQRDPHTARHCERLAVMSVALGLALHLDRTSLVALYRGAYLHDVGKVGIPDEILFHPGRLTAEQWVIMRSHTVRGEEICRHVKTFKHVLPIIRHHHERWDGSGYPDGLRGAQIPLLARVLQIADIYDALTSARPYKPAYSVTQALWIIEQETARGLRDPEIVSLFFQLHSNVISQIDRLGLAQDVGFESMRDTLCNLQQALNAAGANARISSHPLRSEPQSGSPWAAGDMWRTG